MSHRLLAGLLAVPLLTLPAFAADIAQPEPSIPVVAQEEGWIVTLKGTGAVGPKFEGSGKYGPKFLPAISLRRPNQPWKFGAPDDGFGFAIINTDWVQFGPVGRIRGERDNKRDHKFDGMHDIDWGIEPGAFVEVYPFENFRIRGELRHGFWGHHGFVGNISGDWFWHVDRVTFSIGPRMELGDHKFMDEYFGVSANEAIRNGRITPYKADGGIKSVGAASALTYQWTDHWSATLFGRYDRLTGDAGKSPVAKKLGSKNAFTVGLGVGYSFNWN